MYSIEPEMTMERVTRFFVGRALLPKRQRGTTRQAAFPSLTLRVRNFASKRQIPSNVFRRKAPLQKALARDES